MFSHDAHILSNGAYHFASTPALTRFARPVTPTETTTAIILSLRRSRLPHLQGALHHLEARDSC